MTPPSQPSQLWNCQPPSAAGSPYGLRSKNRTLFFSLLVLGLLLLLGPFPKTPTRREKKKYHRLSTGKRSGNPPED